MALAALRSVAACRGTAPAQPLLLARDMRRRAIVVIMGVGLGVLPAFAMGVDIGTPPSRCPGYVVHLQGARAYLARSDRAGAAAELRQAEKALDSCIRGEAEGNAVAEASPSLRAG
jgi:hypothetical protein